MLNADPIHNAPPLDPSLSRRAARLLLILARDAMEQNWTLLDASRIGTEMGVRNSELLQLLRELESARLVERWPLGSLVYLTTSGRRLARRLALQPA